MRFRLAFLLAPLIISSNVIAQNNKPLPTDLRGFKLGMSYSETKTLAHKIFGTPISKFCGSKLGDESNNIQFCDLSTVYGMHQEKNTMFIPAKGSFELGQKELNSFHLIFYKGKLYKLAGAWQGLPDEYAAKDLLHSFLVKFGEPQRVEEIPPKTSKSEVVNPLHHSRYQWVDHETRLIISLEVLEYPLASKDLGRPDIDVDAEFELVDEVTNRFVEKENKPRNEALQRQFIERGLGL